MGRFVKGDKVKRISGDGNLAIGTICTVKTVSVTGKNIEVIEYPMFGCSLRAKNFELVSTWGRVEDPEHTPSCPINTIVDNGACTCEWLDVLKEGCKCGAIVPFLQRNKG